MDEIIPNLFLSNWEASNNKSLIAKKQIKAVITIETTPKPRDILEFYKANNIDFMYLALGDLPSENIAKYFNTSYDFINRHISRGESVLVHCAAGVSRSVTLVINYIIRKYFIGQSNDSPDFIVDWVINFIRGVRPYVNPNSGFRNQLINASPTRYRTLFPI